MPTEYRLFPLAVSVGRRFRLVLTATPPRKVGRLSVSVVSVHDFRSRRSVEALPMADGSAACAVTPEVVGEHLVWVYENGGEWPHQPVTKLSFFALPEGLATKIPWKGDLHMHTVRSDGSESEHELFARMRGLGMDFVAITDHRVYGSGGDALDGDLVVLPGEEINYCQGLGHVVALNTGHGVADRLPPSARGDDRGYLESFANIDEIAEGVRATLTTVPSGPTEADEVLFGYLNAVVSSVHAAGGIAVAAHPYWGSHGAMDLVRSTWDSAVRTGLFDAAEVFGGMSLEENLFSAAGYSSGPAAAQTPIVGCSDSHGPGEGWAGKAFTIVFSEMLSPDSIVDSILSRRSVACLKVGDEDHLIIGDPFLVEYAHFLTRTFFRHHDPWCKIIGTIHAAVADDALRARASIEAWRRPLEDEYRRSFPEAFSADSE